jgi:hypothetical protein
MTATDILERARELAHSIVDLDLIDHAIEIADHAAQFDGEARWFEQVMALAEELVAAAAETDEAGFKEATDIRSDAYADGADL